MSYLGLMPPKTALEVGREAAAAGKKAAAEGEEIVRRACERYSLKLGLSRPKPSDPNWRDLYPRDIRREDFAAVRKDVIEGERQIRRLRKLAIARTKGQWPKEARAIKAQIMASIRDGLTRQHDVDYYLTEVDKENIHAVVYMMQLAFLTTHPPTRKAAYFTVSIHLERLRAVEGRTSADFAAIVRNECGIGKSRAYELLRFPRRGEIRRRKRLLVPHDDHQVPQETPENSAQAQGTNCEK
jgi:hypothetical protein